MIAIEDMVIVMYWPGYDARDDVGETWCRKCGEVEGLPSGDAQILYAATEELLDRLDEDPDYGDLCCDKCGGVILTVAAITRPD